MTTLDRHMKDSYGAERVGCVGVRAAADANTAPNTTWAYQSAGQRFLAECTGDGFAVYGFLETVGPVTLGPGGRGSSGASDPQPQGTS